MSRWAQHSGSEDHDRSARVAVALWVGAALLDLALGRQLLATVEGVAGVAALAALGAPRAIRGQALVVASGAGLVVVGHLSGGLTSVAVAWLLGIPLLAAYLLGFRRPAPCVAASTLAIVGLGLLGVVSPPTELARAAWEQPLGVAILVVCVSAAAFHDRSTSERRVRTSLARVEEADDQSRALLDARDSALATAEAKGRFLAHMSHEIRTPLNGVIGLTTVLATTELTREQRDLVRTIERSGSSLLAIVNDVLDFSKIEAGRVEIDSIPFDLRVCAEDVLGLFAADCDERGVDLALRHDHRAPRWVLGDPTRLRQILVNLVGNAVKFTAEGAITLHVARRGDRAEIEVRDTGIGIEPELRDKLFEPFAQAEPGRRAGGTGLGLAISRRLVEMLGGELTLDSELGRGSTFRFSLPIESAPRDDGSLAGDALAFKSVVLVEPREQSRLGLEETAIALGMRVSAAADVADARARAGDGCDVVLLADGLPDLARAAAEARRAFPGAPHVLLTSSVDGRASQPAGLGFRGVIAKPVRESELITVLVAVLEGRAPAAELVTHSAFDSGLGDRLRLRILVAEDNPVNQLVSRNILERLGYSPNVVSTGAEVIEALHRQSYDVVLMDVQMPVMDGLEATRRVRAELPPDRQPKIIATTANVLEEQRQACFDAGMDDFVAKPLQVHELTHALERVAGGRAGDVRIAALPSAESPLDKLKILCGDDAKKFGAIVRAHVDNARSLLTQIEEALAAGEVELVTRGAHSLKGTSAQFGSTRVSEIAAELEHLSESREADGRAQATLERLSRAVSDAEARLEAEMRAYGAE